MAIKHGTSGNDILLGGPAADVLLGLAGNDVLIGGAGNDRLDGGAGNDRLVGGAGNDTLIGGAGVDRLRGDAGDDVYVIDGATEIDKSVTDTGHDAVQSSVSYLLGAQQEDLTLTGIAALAGTGNGAANSLFGNAGANRLSGGGGDDVLIGGAGNDVLDGGAGNDHLRGGAGNDVYVIDGVAEIDRTLVDAGVDTVKSSINYVLGTQQENLTLIGVADVDASGNAGANTLIGNAGDNVLDGGAGADSLFGGAGNDVLLYDANDVLRDGGDGEDSLRFRGAGLDVRSLIASGVQSIEVLDFRHSGENSLEWTGNGEAELEILRLSGTGTMRIRADGDNTFSFVTVSHLGTWVAGQDVVIDGVVYDQYTFNGFSEQLTLQVQSVPGIVPLSSLNGDSGFRAVLNVSDSTSPDNRTYSSAGDVNGDGFNDLLIGSPLSGGNGFESGSTFVVFGNPDRSAATVNLSTLDGTNGFRLDGAQVAAHSGRAVSAAGDINGDGYGDLLMGSFDAHHASSFAGAVYVIYGAAGDFASRTNLDAPGPSQAYLFSAGGDTFGPMHLASAGDVNGDGYDDVVIGTPYADSNGISSGSAYVVFGQAANLGANFDIDTLDGHNGFRLTGAATEDYAGFAVSSAGDFNGDGFGDLVIGAKSGGFNPTGKAYVVFGAAGGFAADINLASLDGHNGFSIGTTIEGSQLGKSVAAAGDINGDGLGDILIGYDGGAYVLFGTASEASAHFVFGGINGQQDMLLFGGVQALSAAGDINGDGYDDLFVGNPDASPHDTSFGNSTSGSSYVVFGHAGAPRSFIDVTGVGGSVNGMQLDGAHGSDRTGSDVSVLGDIDGDGLDDMLINAYSYAGSQVRDAAYVVYGDDTYYFLTQRGGDGNDNFVGTAANDSLVGGRGNDTLDGGAGSDALLGGAGNDVLVWDAADHRIDGGSGLDTLRVDGAGVTLDLTLTANNRISGIETIDLSGSGNNSLLLNIGDVLALPDHSNSFLANGTRQLLIDGNAGDSVHASGQGWIAGGNVVVDGGTYASYSQTGIAAELLIAVDLTRDIS